MTTESERVSLIDRLPSARRLRREVGALTTELAILVAVLVVVAIALAAAINSSASSHTACIPQTPGAGTTC